MEKFLEFLDNLPELSQKDVLRYSQYLVYFVAFGFCMVVLGRVANFLAVVGGWIAWFAWPFVLLFGGIGQLLIG